MNDWYSMAGWYVCCEDVGLAFEAGAGAVVEVGAAVAVGSGCVAVGCARSGLGIPSLLLWPVATTHATARMQTTRTNLLIHVLRS
jgi:hypothetical protein